jgi:hypothetical protein
VVHYGALGSLHYDSVATRSGDDTLVSFAISEATSQRIRGIMPRCAPLGVLHEEAGKARLWFEQALKLEEALIRISKREESLPTPSAPPTSLGPSASPSAAVSAASPDAKRRRQEKAASVLDEASSADPVPLLVASSDSEQESGSDESASSGTESGSDSEDDTCSSQAEANLSGDAALPEDPAVGELVFWGGGICVC